MAASCRTECSCCKSWLDLNAGMPRMVWMQEEMAFMTLSAGVTEGLVIRLCWNSTVSLKRSLLVCLMWHLWVRWCSGEVWRYQPSTEWNAQVPRESDFSWTWTLQPIGAKGILL